MPSTPIYLGTQSVPFGNPAFFPLFREKEVE